ncbi:hypothetical protein BG57_28650 [Caballeronia grimmiae]|uniref:Uncharacterized protein n=1 Tax=Caballeronia grimmiae TaxID=1071679 RepID=A0A069NCT0_9BURK|nr:hypothetical protein BG57_28650 [Caballeronia grimmiae]
MEFAMSRLIKVGNHEYHVVVHPLVAGGFAFTVVDIDLTGPKSPRLATTAQLCSLPKKTRTAAVQPTHVGALGSIDVDLSQQRCGAYQ